jgi:hypothetical protein
MMEAIGLGIICGLVGGIILLVLNWDLDFFDGR